jgi:hypothetical protein
MASRSEHQETLRWLTRIVLITGTLVLGAYFIREGVRLSQDTYAKIKSDYVYQGVPKVPRNDFSMFYTGSKTVRSSHRSETYDLSHLVRRILVERGYDPATIPDKPDPYSETNKWLRYYNPPFFLLALSPLTLFDVRTAYLVATGLNLGLLIALAGSLGFVLRWRQPETLLLGVALFGFSPLYTSLHHAQPTILLSLLLTMGYLALRNGRYLLAGALLAFMALKPQWTFPGATAIRTQPRLILPLVAASFVLVVLPFALLGPDALIDYVRLVTGRGNDDLSNNLYSGAVLSWAGFFRALTGEAQPVLWLVASVVTLLVFGLLWRFGRAEASIAGGVVVCLIVVPHSHPQDWLLVVPAAAILLSVRWGLVAHTGIASVLLATFLAANDWQSAQAQMDATGEAVFWVTLTAFALLVWLAAVSVFEARHASALPSPAHRVLTGSAAPASR